MRIVRVRAAAFGPFRGCTLEFAPGMTVVHGANESGKSTWHAALYAGVCGIRRGPGLRREDRLFAERHRPWDGDDWAVAADVELDDGRRLELHHDLDGSADCRVTDLATGRDIASALLHDGAPDGAKLLGLNRRTFLATVCVRQADVLAVLHHADDLQEQLQRAAATGGRDANAEEAIRAIDAYRREHVGTDRVNATRPLRTATNRKAAAENDLRAARDAHQGYLELVRRRDRAEDEAGEVERQLAAVTAAAAHDRLRQLEERLRRARRLSRQLDDVAAVEVADGAVAREVEDAVSAYRARPSPPQPLDGRTADELAAELEMLAEHPDGDIEPAAEVDAALERWRDARSRLGHHREDPPRRGKAPDTGGATPAELRQAADDVEASAPPVDPELERRVAELRAGEGPAVGVGVGIVVAVVGVVAAAGLFAAGQLAAGGAALAVGLAAAAFAASRRSRGAGGAGNLPQLEARLALQQEAGRHAEGRRDTARQRCGRWGVPTDPSVLRRLAREVDDASDGAHAADRWAERDRRLAGEVADAERGLRAVLAIRGVDGAADTARKPDELVRDYHDACRRRARQAREASRRAPLQAALAARQAAEAQVAATSNRRDDAARRVAEVAGRVGVAADDPDDAFEALLKWLDAREAALEAAHEADIRRAALDEVLDGRSLDELQRDVERRRAELPDPPADDVVVADDVDEQLGRLEAEARRLRGEADHLAGQVADRGRQLPSVAEAEESLEAAERELARVRRLDADLARAHEFLSAARDRVHRDIAPVLAEAVGRRLPAITAGRYVDAIVDPSTLGVQVRTADGRLRDAARLSHGTTEQVYLLLRLAMAEHLVTTGETAPIILDDALVQTDSARAAACLDLLHRLSADRQVIVFSQEDDVLAWARSRLGLHDRLEQLDPSLVNA